MTGAALYIVICTARNRLRRRLQRLREPRYLIGAIVGIAYLWATLFFRAQAYRVRNDPGAIARRGPPATPFGAAAQAIAGVLLACAAAACWLMPFTSSLLNFSQAEIALLFPAPVTRRALVLYRLIRSQLAVLIGAMIVALAYPIGSLAGRLRGLAAIWLLLMTAHVFFTGVNAARTRMASRRQSQWFGAWLGLLWPFAALVTLGAALAGAASRMPFGSARAFTAATASAAGHGTPALLLWPFTSVVRPIFQSDARDYVESLIVAAALYGAAVLWLLWMDAGSEISAKTVVASMGQGPRSRARVYSSRPVAWTLAPRGRVETVFVWKAALQTFRIVDRRVLIRLLLILASMVAASVFVTRVRGFVQVIGLFAAWGAGFATVMASQIIRIDLRQDLAHLELLKTWPVRGAAVVRGELAWPAMLVTAIALTLGVVALVLMGATLPSMSSVFATAAGVSVLILVPGVVFLQYAIHNAVALFLPGWVPLGSARPRGVDAMGQRLMLLGGTWLALAAGLVPGAVVTLVLWLTLRNMFGGLILVAGSAISTATLTVEFLAVTAMLGRVYDRLDITSIERPE
jgi:hypothetical protein